MNLCDSQGGGHARVPEDCSGSGNVRRQLLRDQEQEDHRLVAGSRRSGAEHLREERQVSLP